MGLRPSVWVTLWVGCAPAASPVAEPLGEPGWSVPPATPGPTARERFVAEPERVLADGQLVLGGHAWGPGPAGDAGSDVIVMLPSGAWLWEGGVWDPSHGYLGLGGDLGGAWDLLHALDPARAPDTARLLHGFLGDVVAWGPSAHVTVRRPGMDRPPRRCTEHSAEQRGPAMAVAPAGRVRPGAGPSAR